MSAPLTDRVTLAARITVLTSLAVGVTLTVVSVAVYVTLRMELQSSLDESLRERASDTAASTVDAAIAGEDYPRWVLTATDVRIAVAGSGEVVSNDTSADQYVGEPEQRVAAGLAAESMRTALVDGSRYRVAAVPLPGGQALVLAQSMEPTYESLERLAVVAWAVGLTGVFVAGLAGWAVANNGLRPVRRLTEAAERVARTDDLRPITVTGTDELARLTSSFNSMLTALSASRNRQIQLVADAGHELRTPLTSLRTNLELLGQADRHGGLPDAARGELLTDVTAQVDELATLVGDLVELARDEPLHRHPEPTDLADVVDAAVVRVRRRAAGVRIDVTARPWMVVGEPQLLERAVTNLLDNAVRWSPPNGVVDVRLDGDGALTIRDHGPGIAGTDLPYVFDRFYRAREARSLAGSGLGLAIVRRAAERHGGHVNAANSADGGAVLTLVVPGR